MTYQVYLRTGASGPFRSPMSVQAESPDEAANKRSAVMWGDDPRVVQLLAVGGREATIYGLVEAGWRAVRA